MNKTTSRILLALGVVVFAIGIYLMMSEPDGDGRKYSPIMPTGAVITILIIMLARRRRMRREEENRLK
jgi:hypothetical protein